MITFDHIYHFCTPKKKLYPYFRNDRQGKLAQLRAKQLEDAIKVPVIVYNED